MSNQNSDRIERLNFSLRFALKNASQNIGHGVKQAFEPFRLLFHVLVLAPLQFVRKLFSKTVLENRSNVRKKNSVTDDDRYLQEVKKLRWSLSAQREIKNLAKTVWTAMTSPFWFPWRLIKALFEPRRY